MLAITLGDPTGIGPEVLLKALGQRPIDGVVVYGDRGVLEETARQLGTRVPQGVQIEEVTSLAPHQRVPGQPNDAAGRAQVAYLEAATEAAMSGRVKAIVTAPLSKTWAGRAGFQFPGHTEYLAQAAHAPEIAMMLAGPRLKTTVATTHIALRDVAASLTVSGVSTAIRLTARALQQHFGLPHPRIAVAALNPHAGEDGRFGDEEARIIEPAIAAARRELEAQGSSPRLYGPAVPDVVFRQAHEGQFDAVVAMYHDQGLIPVKLFDFDHTVNVTLGLPFVRTSPDHGTAYDLAGKGLAREDSLLAAFDLARQMVARARG
ncbi:MAG: 4-hydroxythreonine-4-phosphate dehydrogenase PdxA [Myxococcales bacterium]|nr:4-hydroxythreonine-4-phosphate dehydrogenase PdxA [Myxococcales bacterium]